MAHLAIIIEDPQKAYDADVERNVSANLAHLSKHRAVTPQDRDKVTALVRARIGGQRAAGDLHTVVEDACPDGLPNCRNCGDPAHEATCQAAGHCPCCGRNDHVPGLLAPPKGRGGHGLAPQSYLAATGLSVAPIDPPQDGHVWDRAQRQFRPRTPGA